MPYRNNFVFPVKRINVLLKIIRKISFIVLILKWLGSDFKFARKLYGGCWKYKGYYIFRGKTVLVYKPIKDLNSLSDLNKVILRDFKNSSFLLEEYA